jgi:hypothetical protein
MRFPYVCRAFGLLFTALAFFAVTVFAQGPQATITGQVTDQSDRVVPGATVVYTNVNTNVPYTTQTNGEGIYRLGSLQPGIYRANVTKDGFTSIVKGDIELHVQDQLSINFTLQVGSVSETITVRGGAPRVQTESGTVSDVVTGSQIAEMGLDGRSLISLYMLAPGAAPGIGTDVENGLYFARTGFNGTRASSNNIEVDGGSNANETAGGWSLVTLPSIDTLAEFRISTSNYGADTGRHAGALIEIATKSGTRQFHGEAYEFVRNDRVDANDWFLNRQIAPPGGHASKRPLKWNDFGYNVGGPFYIPGHYNTDKSKTFFFWSQNWRRYRQGTVINAGVPSLRMRNGDFSECDSGSPNFNAIAASGCALPTVNGTTLDTVSVDPNAKALLDAYVPLPNNGIVGYLASHSLITNWRSDQIRVDQNISDKTVVLVRFTNEDWFLQELPPYAGAGSYDIVVSQRDREGQIGALHVTHSFKPNLMNESILSFSANCFCVHKPIIGPASVSHSMVKPSTWTANNLFPPNKSNPLLPGVSVGGGGPSFVGDWGFTPNISPIFTPTVKDNVTYSVGKHSLKLGFLLQKIQENLPFGFDTQGFMSFQNYSAISTGNGLADMYLGRMAQYTEGTLTANGVPVGGYGKGYWRYTDFEPYFQDDWKVTRKLTLNLGARYYFFQPPHEITRPQSFDTGFFPGLYNPATEALLDLNGNLVKDPATGHVYDYTTFGNGLVECGKGGIRKGCIVPSRWTLAPRFGFAYDPTGRGKTAIRGGYGIYYDFNNTDLWGYVNPPQSLTPSGFNILGYQNITPGPISPNALYVHSYHEKWPSTQQFNLTIQHEFPGNNLLSVGYVGSLGRHLFRIRNLNQVPVGVGTEQVLVKNPATGAIQPLPDPACDAAGNCSVQDVLINNRWPSAFFVPYRGYTGIYLLENSAVSHYNSLQVNFRHTVGHGLTLETAYTWSHMLDDSSSPFSTSGLGVDDNHLSRWYATSSWNQTHVLVMNYIYDLPFFKNSSSPVVRQTLGGWKISGITSFFTGPPEDFGCGINGFSSGIGGGIRCNTLGPVKIKKGTIIDPQFGPTPSWFDPSTIAQPLLSQLRADNQPGMFGYQGRNQLTGPGRNNWDLTLLKDFQLPWFRGEHSTLQFRWETFNTFNHPQWEYANAGCSGATTPGQPCTGAQNIGNGEVGAAWPPRIMQFGLKLIW